MSLRQLKKSLKLSFQELTNLISAQINNYIPYETDEELTVAKLGNYFLTDPVKYKQEIELIIDWCIYILRDNSADSEKKKWSIFSLPQKMDFNYLVPVQSQEGKKYALDDDLRHRDGFKLTDSGMSTRPILKHRNCSILFLSRLLSPTALSSSPTSQQSFRTPTSSTPSSSRSITTYLQRDSILIPALGTAATACF